MRVNRISNVKLISEYISHEIECSAYRTLKIVVVLLNRNRMNVQVSDLEMALIHVHGLYVISPPF